MKVLHVIPMVSPRYGGPSAAIGPMVVALNRQPGVRAEVATTDADGPRNHMPPEHFPTHYPAHVFHRTWTEQWMFSRGLWRWLRQHTKDYDVVHIHGIWSFATAAAARAAVRADVPYIVRPAGSLNAYCLKMQGFKKKVYRYLIEQETFRRAAGFHATSSEEARDIDAAIPGARTFVIPHGMEDAAWNVPADAGRLRSLCGATVGSDPIVLFLGRLHPIKGITDLLLPAFARLRSPAHLALAGGPDPRAPGYDQEIRRQIDRLNIRERVTLLGHIGREDRWTLFDGASAFVLPSFSENFGIVVAEAMARACPVVVADTVNSCEHVKAAGCGDVVPREIGPFAAALDSVLTDPTARNRLGKAGAKYAADRLAWPRFAHDLLNMYRSVTNGTPQASAESNTPPPRTPIEINVPTQL